MQDPTGLRTVRPDLAEPRDERPPPARNALAEGTGKPLDQAAAATPHGKRHFRRWVLGVAAAVVIVTGAVVAAATGVLGNPDSVGSTDSIGSSPPLVPGRTYTETVNSPAGARTYRNPHTLTGEGPRIDNRTNVHVLCKIAAPTASSVGTYWYRIASQPWNNQYYSPANSFLNGDSPDGSSSTHVVDDTVPNCPH